MNSGLDWEDKPELNITPLVDVMLVLIAILMLTTPLILYEEKISLAKGSAKQKYNNKNSNIEIRVDIKKNIYIDDQQFEFNGFADSFVQFSSRFPSRKNKVLIRADKNLKYEDIIFILRSVKAANFTKISLVTDG